MVSSTSCVFFAALFRLSMQDGRTAETNHSVTVSKVFCSLLASCTWNAWRSEVGNFNQEIPTSNADWNAAFIFRFQRSDSTLRLSSSCTHDFYFLIIMAYWLLSLQPEIEQNLDVIMSEQSWVSYLFLSVFHGYLFLQMKEHTMY